MVQEAGSQASASRKKLKRKGQHARPQRLRLALKATPSGALWRRLRPDCRWALAELVSASLSLFDSCRREQYKGVSLDLTVLPAEEKGSLPRRHRKRLFPCPRTNQKKVQTLVPALSFLCIFSLSELLASLWLVAGSK